MPNMAAEAANLWLPGFGDNTAETFPDLFVDAAEPAPEATEVVAPQARKVWRATAAATVDCPTSLVLPVWCAIAANELDGPVSKFEANLAAIAVLRRMREESRTPTQNEREELLRFTGWGGIPASFNLESRDEPWRRKAERLALALSADEYASAKASVNNSHYTEPHLIRWIWSSLRVLGFEGGRVLEPSAGIGHFVGCMPPEVAARSRVTAIELDAVAGSILRALYESAGVDVRVDAFERADLASESFDLAISNVPFGNYQVNDGRNRPYSRFSIHNWFAGKALEAVRPGGLVAFITSSYFLDERDRSARAYVASQADLVFALRLPSGTFARLASTTAQADLVVLQKRRHGEQAQDNLTWLELGFVPETLRHPNCSDRYMQINGWLVSHPANVIGRISRESNGYSAIPTAVLDGDFSDALEEVSSTVPRGIYQPPAPRPSGVQEVSRPATCRPGKWVVHNGRISIDVGGELLDVHDRTNRTAQARIAGMCVIRDQARALLDAQLGDASDAELDGRRRVFSRSYDVFVARHGCLSNRANALAFRRDPDYPLLLSLEHYDEEEQIASKADIFFRRTVARVQEPGSAAGPEEALALCVQWRGKVDVAYIAGLLGSDVTSVAPHLLHEGLIYEDPIDGGYETADAYLSGDVKRKLRAAAAAGAPFSRNVAALERVIPEDLPPASIEPRLGAVWIPSEVVESFLVEVLGLASATVRYLDVAGAWSVHVDRWIVRGNVRCTQEFGTSRMDAIELVQCALNVQTPTVRDPHPDKEGAFVVNKEQTLAAREKLGSLKERFAAWSYEDPRRRERLCRIYNDLFNCLRAREFDGSHLHLPGFSRCFTLHSSQLNAIWRIVQSGNTGLFHAVGAGKTAIMVAASMELRRLGLAKKPAHVVPNHMLHAYCAEFARLYPAASVLMANHEDLAADRRREFVSRIATGDWDAVVMTHSTFELLPMSREFSQRYIASIIQELELAVKATKADDRSNRIIKQLERMKKVWKVRLERLEHEERKDDFMQWEALGIDWVCHDESHLAKNLFRHTKMARIAGLPLANSQRAFDLYMKTRYTMELHGGRQRGVVLATATPVANSMAEIHTFQRYLQPTKLRELGLEQFDAWAATFGETVTALEIAPDGSGYRLNTRFARFINVPDLMAVFCDVSDIRTREMLALPVPRLKGEKPRTVTCPPSPQLKAFVRSLVERAEHLKTARVDPRVDNMLKITSDGRKAALDMRLIDAACGRDPAGKVAACAHEVHRIWRETAAQRRAQLVFCDLSTPNGEAFNVYDDLRAQLLDLGVSAEGIAFVHDAGTDAQKARLFRRVREGHVRVLVGSTQKMGIGTNVQERLVALHELDCPWRPCDVEQREGRILRQGNSCEEVEIIRYVTEASFDAYSWQTVLTKSRFIAQVMTGDKGLRSIEDVELATLSYAEVKALASGNPKVIEKAGVDAEVARYASLFSVWRNQRYENESDVANLPLRIQSTARLMEALTTDVSQAALIMSQGLVANVQGISYRDREGIGEALRSVVRVARGSVFGSRRRDELVGDIGAFKLSVFVGRNVEDVHLYLQGQAVHDCDPRQTGPALYGALVDTLQGMETRRLETVAKLSTLQRRLAALQEELHKPFEYEERLMALIVRQRELERELDIDRDEVGSAVLDAEEQALAA